MGKKDLTDMLGGGGGRTKQKYRCKADGCQVTPMGVNLAKHYKVNTDWVLLKELKACVGDAALKKKMDQTDPHTRYIFEKGYSKKRLPQPPSPPHGILQHNSSTATTTASKKGLP